jgi:CheY-like chemotaxis protein
MNEINILWVDDEIELLKPHIIFLEKKNYKVTSCNNGNDALELLNQSNYDIVFLDENMPGLSGLDTLNEIKLLNDSTPVVMITKSEEEYIMEEAIGNKIADYLIKPVNPNQILLSLKKILDENKLVSAKTTSSYQQDFRKIAMDLTMINTIDEWIDIYKKLISWEIKLENTNDSSMHEILESQKSEANVQFSKFIENEYESWFDQNQSNPILSHQIFKEWVIPELNNNQTTLFIVIDNLRYDQWKSIEPFILEDFKILYENTYSSILPTATQYSRNAIFSGLTPLEMQKIHPDLWKNDTDDGGKNLNEYEFLNHQFKRLGFGHISHEYFKINNVKTGKKLIQNLRSLKSKSLVSVVYNFVDMLSHSKTEMDVIKELASTDKAYRSLTQSWFKNSPLIELIKVAKSLDFKLIITTDHGTINVKSPTKVIGDKDTSLNLRYKTGRSLTYNNKDVYAMKSPNKIALPSINMTSSFIFAKNDLFLAYPNNFNHYANYFKNTYQHGGISLEEMILPFIVLEPKN